MRSEYLLAINQSIHFTKVKDIIYFQGVGKGCIGNEWINANSMTG